LKTIFFKPGWPKGLPIKFNNMTLAEMQALIGQFNCHIVSAEAQTRGTGKEKKERVVSVVMTGSKEKIHKITGKLMSRGYVVMSNNDENRIHAQKERMK
jgi:hypothetical protein